MTFVPTAYDPYDFANRRHIGPAPEEMAQILSDVGCRSLDELIDQTAAHVADAVVQPMHAPALPTGHQRLEAADEEEDRDGEHQHP